MSKKPKTQSQKYNAKKKRIAKEAGRLWQIVIKKLHPKCEVCGRPTEVGHHFIYQSVSNYLKYKIKNGIGLCVRCHYLLHINRASEFGVIIQKGRGDEWFDDLMSDRN